MKRLNYFFRLGRELFEFSFKRKVYWLIPLLLLLLPIALLIVGGEAGSPLIYTMF